MTSSNAPTLTLIGSMEDTASNASGEILRCPGLSLSKWGVPCTASDGVAATGVWAVADLAGRLSAWIDSGEFSKSLGSAGIDIWSPISSMALIMRLSALPITTYDTVRRG